VTGGGARWRGERCDGGGSVTSSVGNYHGEPMNQEGWGGGARKKKDE
jgi:hypothetical protein